MGGILSSLDGLECPWAAVFASPSASSFGSKFWWPGTQCISQVADSSRFGFESAAFPSGLSEFLFPEYLVLTGLEVFGCIVDLVKKVTSLFGFLVIDCFDRCLII